MIVDWILIIIFHNHSHSIEFESKLACTEASIHLQDKYKGLESNTIKCFKKYKSKIKDNK